MRKISIVLIILFSPFATNLRAAPVQWKIEDGGNGHYYEAIIASNMMSWYEAKSDAELRGGYLATITSPEEDLFIENNFLISPSTSSYFLGGFQQPFPNGNWQWITGEVWDYQNWGIWPDGGHEPSGDGEALMVWAYSDLVAPAILHGKWNDISGTLTETIAGGLGSYIMEIPEPATLLILGLGGLFLRKRRM